MPMTLRAARKAYAQELRVTGPALNDPRVVKAFETVPREDFVGPGPWLLRAGSSAYRTPDADPRWLYHNVLVALDARKGVNNGEPSFWASHFDRLGIKAGARVFQVGAGTGYYTAILATLVGPRGKVVAVEYDARLARAAERNLRGYKNVVVTCADASMFDPGDVDVVVVFAGGTHPVRTWADRLSTGGRLLMPLVTDAGGGFMLKVTRTQKTYRAEAAGWCGFILAEGFRTKIEARALKTALDKLVGKMPVLHHMFFGKPSKADAQRAFMTGRDYWLSLKARR